MTTTSRRFDSTRRRLALSSPAATSRASLSSSERLSSGWRPTSRKYWERESSLKHPTYAEIPKGRIGEIAQFGSEARFRAEARPGGLAEPRRIRRQEPHPRRAAAVPAGCARSIRASRRRFASENRLFAARGTTSLQLPCSRGLQRRNGQS